MPCSHCGRHEGERTPPCPHCPDAVPVLASPPETQGEQGTPVDPEVLPPEEPRATPRNPFAEHTVFEQGQGTHQQTGSTFRFTMWQGGGGGMGMDGMRGAGMFQSSCLPGCITLFLLLVCTVQFGVLAAMGFLFFHLVGSGLMLTFNPRQLMQARPAYPWVGRIVVWCASWVMVAWLSDNI